MNKKTYKLTFLPLFEQDLMDVAYYITNKLKNPSAANNLINDIEKAIMHRLKMPLSFSPYISSKSRKNTYYRIDVKNFSIFYIVNDDTMEVHRLLYSKRNINKFLD